MIKKLQKIGNSKGIILEKPLLALINAENSDQVEIESHKDGLLIKKKIDVASAYSHIAKKHRTSLDKLGQ